ncbi:MAG: DUF4836 family protein, partial [Bacteroidetes bacterium]|nr:DUF4836 family protein [Bacteroidota bacterium]
LVGFYLSYNFNAKTRLLQLIPDQSNWFLHVQTKQLRSDFSESPKPPAAIDTLVETISHLAVFKKIKDPKTPGIGLYSDVLVFGIQEGIFFCLSLSSEAKFKIFFQQALKNGLLALSVDKGNYYYAKCKDKNVYIAFKSKALVVYIPKDTVVNTALNETVLGLIFSNKPNAIMQNSTVKFLYEDDPDMIFYSTKPQYGLSQSAYFPKIEKGKEGHLVFRYPNKEGIANPSPLMLASKVGLTVDVEASLNSNNEITPEEALSLLARALNQYLIFYNQ